MFRTRLTLTQLEQRETPSDISSPTDPNGGSTTPDTTAPAQTTTPPTTSTPTDPVGTSP